MDNKPKVVCLMPVKNEDWILERSLQSASLWADQIIVLDQNSTDSSAQIAKRFPEVILITNESRSFNEPERQRMLIDEARRIPGQNVLIALDADESLTANSIGHDEWKTIKALPPGTVIRFELVNLLPAKNIYWSPTYKFPFGFIDDGSSHTGESIHSHRIPTPENGSTFYPRQIKVMHFQYADWRRMRSKHRWYQCFEHIMDAKRSAISIYRAYHHMYAVPKDALKTIPSEWLAAYDERGIDLRNFTEHEYYYWDYEIIQLFKQHGTRFFSRIDVWDIDWTKLAKEEGLNAADVTNPQSLVDKALSTYLEKTQPHISNIFMRIFDRIARMFF